VGVPARPGPAISLFAGLTDTEVVNALAQGKTLDVAPKTVLCTSGEPATRLFLLLKGRVNFSHLTREGDEILLRLLAPGESFGLGALLPDPPHYLGTAQAVFASRVVVWTHAQARRLVTSHNQIATNALGIALRFLGQLVNRHSSLFEGDASHRVARALIDVGRRSGHVHPEGIDIHITNEQLGSLADVSRFTASRVLSNWKKTGIITKERESVRIHSPESLVAD
jgi:CRP/FNR family transcriptional regulator, nitrogen oxide reductase regulator